MLISNWLRNATVEGPAHTVPEIMRIVEKTLRIGQRRNYILLIISLTTFLFLLDSLVSSCASKGRGSGVEDERIFEIGIDGTHTVEEFPEICHGSAGDFEAISGGRSCGMDRMYEEGGKEGDILGRRDISRIRIGARDDQVGEESDGIGI